MPITPSLKFIQSQYVSLYVSSAWPRINTNHYDPNFLCVCLKYHCCVGHVSILVITVIVT